MAVFDWTGPASFNEDYLQEVAPYFFGYALRDFTATPVTSRLNMTTHPPWLTGLPLSRANVTANATFLHSPGAVTLNPPAGAKVQVGTMPIRVPVTALIPAGYVLITVQNLFDQASHQPPNNHAGVVVTDATGGNVVVWGGITSLGLGPQLFQTNAIFGLYQWWILYKINNPIPAGGWIEVDVTNWEVMWAASRLHPLQGLTAGSEIGPNPPNPYIGFGTAEQSNPALNLPGLVPPQPVWNGFFWVGGITGPDLTHPFPPDARVVYDLNIARGVTIHVPESQTLGTDKLIQAPSGDIILTDNCRVEVDTVFLDGSSRSGQDDFLNVGLTMIVGLNE